MAGNQDVRSLEGILSHLRQLSKQQHANLEEGFQAHMKWLAEIVEATQLAGDENKPPSTEIIPPEPVVDIENITIPETEPVVPKGRRMTRSSAVAIEATSEADAGLSRDSRGRGREMSNVDMQSTLAETAKQSEVAESNLEPETEAAVCQSLEPHQEKRTHKARAEVTTLSQSTTANMPARRTRRRRRKVSNNVIESSVVDAEDQGSDVETTVEPKDRTDAVTEEPHVPEPVANIESITIPEAEPVVPESRRMTRSFAVAIEAPSEADAGPPRSTRGLGRKVSDVTVESTEPEQELEEKESSPEAETEGAVSDGTAMSQPESTTDGPAQRTRHRGRKVSDVVIESSVPDAEDQGAEVETTVEPEDRTDAVTEEPGHASEPVVNIESITIPETEPVVPESRRMTRSFAAAMEAPSEADAGPSRSTRGWGRKVSNVTVESAEAEKQPDDVQSNAEPKNVPEETDLSQHESATDGPARRTRRRGRKVSDTVIESSVTDAEDQGAEMESSVEPKDRTDGVTEEPGHVPEPVVNIESIAVPETEPVVPESRRMTRSFAVAIEASSEADAGPSRHTRRRGRKVSDVTVESTEPEQELEEKESSPEAETEGAMSDGTAVSQPESTIDGPGGRTRRRGRKVSDVVIESSVTDAEDQGAEMESSVEPKDRTDGVTEEPHVPEPVANIESIAIPEAEPVVPESRRMTRSFAAAMEAPSEADAGPSRSTRGWGRKVSNVTVESAEAEKQPDDVQSNAEPKNVPEETDLSQQESTTDVPARRTRRRGRKVSDTVIESFVVDAEDQGTEMETTVEPKDRTDAVTEEPGHASEPVVNIESITIPETEPVVPESRRMTRSFAPAMEPPSEADAGPSRRTRGRGRKANNVTVESSEAGEEPDDVESSAWPKTVPEETALSQLESDGPARRTRRRGRKVTDVVTESSVTDAEDQDAEVETTIERKYKTEAVTEQPHVPESVVNIESITIPEAEPVVPESRRMTRSFAAAMEAPSETDAGPPRRTRGRGRKVSDVTVESTEAERQPVHVESNAEAENQAAVSEERQLRLETRRGKRTRKARVEETAVSQPESTTDGPAQRTRHRGRKVSDVVIESSVVDAKDQGAEVEITVEPEDRTDAVTEEPAHVPEPVVNIESVPIPEAEPVVPQSRRMTRSFALAMEPPSEADAGPSRRTRGRGRKVSDVSTEAEKQPEDVVTNAEPETEAIIEHQSYLRTRWGKRARKARAEETTVSQPKSSATDGPGRRIHHRGRKVGDVVIESSIVDAEDQGAEMDATVEPEDKTAGVTEEPGHVPEPVVNIESIAIPETEPVVPESRRMTRSFAVAIEAPSEADAGPSRRTRGRGRKVSDVIVESTEAEEEPEHVESNAEPETEAAVAEKHQSDLKTRRGKRTRKARVEEGTVPQPESSAADVPARRTRRRGRKVSDVVIESFFVDAEDQGAEMETTVEPKDKTDAVTEEPGHVPEPVVNIESIAVPEAVPVIPESRRMTRSFAPAMGLPSEADAGPSRRTRGHGRKVSDVIVESTEAEEEPEQVESSPEPETEAAVAQKRQSDLETRGGKRTRKARAEDTAVSKLESTTDGPARRTRRRGPNVSDVVIESSVTDAEDQGAEVETTVEPEDKTAGVTEELVYTPEPAISIESNPDPETETDVSEKHQSALEMHQRKRMRKARPEKAAMSQPASKADGPARRTRLRGRKVSDVVIENTLPEAEEQGDETEVVVLKPSPTIGPKPKKAKKKRRLFNNGDQPVGDEVNTDVHPESPFAPEPPTTVLPLPQPQSEVPDPKKITEEVPAKAASLKPTVEECSSPHGASPATPRNPSSGDSGEPPVPSTVMDTTIDISALYPPADWPLHLPSRPRPPRLHRKATARMSLVDVGLVVPSKEPSSPGIVTDDGKENVGDQAQTNGDEAQTNSDEANDAETQMSDASMAKPVSTQTKILLELRKKIFWAKQGVAAVFSPQPEAKRTPSIKLPVPKPGLASILSEASQERGTNMPQPQDASTARTSEKTTTLTDPIPMAKKRRFNIPALKAAENAKQEQEKKAFERRQLLELMAKKKVERARQVLATGAALTATLPQQPKSGAAKSAMPEIVEDEELRKRHEERAKRHADRVMELVEVGEQHLQMAEEQAEVINSVPDPQSSATRDEEPEISAANGSSEDERKLDEAVSETRDKSQAAPTIEEVVREEKVDQDSENKTETCVGSEPSGILLEERETELLAASNEGEGRNKETKDIDIDDVVVVVEDSEQQAKAEEERMKVEEDNRRKEFEEQARRYREAQEEARQLRDLHAAEKAAAELRLKVGTGPTLPTLPLPGHLSQATAAQIVAAPISMPQPPAESHGSASTAATASGTTAGGAPESFPISDFHSDEESDFSDEEERGGRLIPQWAQKANVIKCLSRQKFVDPDTIFPRVATCDLDEIFMSARHGYSRRTSSGNWMQDRLTWKEEASYRRFMGYQAPQSRC